MMEALHFSTAFHKVVQVLMSACRIYIERLVAKRLLPRRVDELPGHQQGAGKSISLVFAAWLLSDRDTDIAAKHGRSCSITTE